MVELGVAKKRAARARRIAAIPEEKRREYAEALKSEDKAVSPDALLRKEREQRLPTAGKPFKGAALKAGVIDPFAGKRAEAA